MPPNASDLTVTAIATIGGVLTDLIEVAERFPVVPAAEVEATARILDRLSEELGEAAAMLRGRQPEPADIAGDDPRVTRARDLLAEQHILLTMSPGEIRQLLARFQRRVTGLLEVIDRQASR